MIRYSIFLFIFLSITALKQRGNNSSIPIIFSEYEVQINSVEKLGDTIFYEKSSVETFKFIFYDRRGKCFCERFLKNKLYEKGNFENSLDTLKRYVSGRFSNGNTTPISVQSFFEPLKNGEWIIYKNSKEIKENYLTGVLQE